MVVGALFSAGFQFSPHMPLYSGEDSFYHVGMSKYILEHGIPQKFPYLYFTHLNQSFVDHELLFHLLLIPFIKIFGVVAGPKIMAILFFALIFAFLYLIFRNRKIKFAPIITIFLLFVMPSDFYFRSAFIRTQTVSLFFMVLALYFIDKNFYKGLFIVSFLYVWLYGGSVFILILIASYFIGQILCQEKIDQKIFLYTISGFAAGILINPYFPKNIYFLYSQIFQTGLGAKGYSGGEWQPYDAWYWVQISIIPILIFLAGIVMALSQNIKRDGKTLAVVIFSLFLLVLQWKSKRFVEYWPFWGATAGVLLLSDTLPKFYQKQKNLFVACFLILFIFTIFKARTEITRGYNDTQTPINPESTKQVNDFLIKNSQSKDIVFTDDWDVFPFYFYYNQKDYFIVGLDPEFMNQYNHDLYEEYALISSGDDSNNLERIKIDFKAKWVLIASDHPQFKMNIEERPDLFDIAYQNSDYSLFKIK